MGRKAKPFMKTVTYKMTEKDIVNMKTIRDTIGFIESDRLAISFALDVAARSAQGHARVPIQEVTGMQPVTLTESRIGRPRYDDVEFARKQIQRDEAKKQYKEVKRTTAFLATCTLLNGQMSEYEGNRLCTYKRYRLGSDGVTVYNEKHTIPEGAGLDEWAKKDQFKNSEEVREDIRKPKKDQVYKYVELENQTHEETNIDDETSRLIEEAMADKME